MTGPAIEIAQNSVFERFARAGYVVSGLLHIIIGYLAIRIALGSGGGSADQSGALAAVSAKPGGSIALWAGVIALLIMALWRLTETALGRSTDPKSQGTMPEILDRAKAFALAVVYCGFAHSTLGFARSSGKSTGDQNSGLSARLMQTASGTAVLIVGAGVLVIIAASLSKPDKATGLDGALKTLGAQPYGAILLIFAGLGIISYGLYSFAMARYTKM